MSDELRKNLASISQDIVNSSFDIQAFSDKIEKECEAERAEKEAQKKAVENAIVSESTETQTSTENIQKYTASLISNYLN